MQMHFLNKRTLGPYIFISVHSLDSQRQLGLFEDKDYIILLMKPSEPTCVLDAWAEKWAKIMNILLSEWNIFKQRKKHSTESLQRIASKEMKKAIFRDQLKNRGNNRMERLDSGKN